MKNLNSKINCWEHERILAIKKFSYEMLHFALYANYLLIKAFVWVVVDLAAEPKLMRQIAPGRYENVK